MKSRRRYLIGGLVVAVAFGVLLFKAFGTFGSYSLTVTQFKDAQSSLGMSLSEFVKAQPTIGDSEVKIHAWVADSNSSSGQTRLTITDGKENLPVVYSGSLAGALAVGTEVVVQGKQEDGAFQADRLTTTKEVRIDGPLSPDVNVEYHVTSRTTKFAIIDPKGSTGPIQSIPVIYTGPVPDTFWVDVKTVDVSMVVVGREGPNGVFLASQLLTRCASKYAAASSTPTPTPTPK